VDVTFMLRSGEDVTIEFDPADGHPEPEDVATFLYGELVGMERPGWLALGNVVVFTGAVCAIEVTEGR
jgi:hypothetical protein